MSDYENDEKTAAWLREVIPMAWELIKLCIQLVLQIVSLVVVIALLILAGTHAHHSEWLPAIYYILMVLLITEWKRDVK